MHFDTPYSFWQTPDGWKLRVAAFAPPPVFPSPRGSILFLNGRADHLEKYEETMRDWANKGWHVEGFDWRGQGGSGRMTPSTSLGHIDDFQPWLDDLQAYARQWSERTPAPHYGIGHSMGGHLLLRALAEGRLKPDAAVLVAPMLGIVSAGLPHSIARRISEALCSFRQNERPLWPDRLRTAETVGALKERLTHSDERFAQEQEVRRLRPDVAMDAPSWGWMRAAYRSIDVLCTPGMIEKVSIPTLILASRADRLVSADAIEAAAKRLPQGHLHFYGAEAAHEILREVDPVRDDALARIEAFLTQQSSIGAAPEG